VGEGIKENDRWGLLVIERRRKEKGRWPLGCWAAQLGRPEGFGGLAN
jgi:hypothetical protein